MVENLNRKTRRPRPNGLWPAFAYAALLAGAAAMPARAQTAPANLGIINNSQTPLLAQAQPQVRADAVSPGVLPTDATKGNFLQDQASAYPGIKLRILQKLPARLWLQSSTEVNQRLDTNVFLTYKEPQPDYVFRVAPSVTVGYNVLEQTSVYAQYFMIKDCYTVHHRPLTEPVTQSVAMGLRHYIVPYASRYATYIDCQARELWQSRGLRQADLNPSINTQWIVNNNFGLYASILMQMRSGQLFQGAQREIDPFYTVGFWTRKGPYVFSFTDTLVTNYREPHFRHSIPAHGNVNMIADIEIARQLGNHPGLQLFIRAEPVFNWRSANAVGLSGFDFRLYSGLRASFYKQSYLATMNQIKKQLQQQDGDAKTGGPGGKPPKGKGKGKSNGKDGKGGKDGKDGSKDGDKKPGTTDPGNTSTAPGATPDTTSPTAASHDAPTTAFEPDQAMGEALGRTFGAIVAPGAGSIIAPMPTASSKAVPPMAHKSDESQKISGGQKAVVQPQA